MTSLALKNVVAMIGGWYGLLFAQAVSGPVAFDFHLILGVLFGSAMGTVIKHQFLKEREETNTVWEYFSHGVLGAAAAYYLLPILLKIVGIVTEVSEDLVTPLAFLLAAVSMNLVAGLVRLFEKFREDPRGLLDWLADWIGAIRDARKSRDESNPPE